MIEAVPYSLEQELKDQGAVFIDAGEPWADLVVVDSTEGRTLITGRNPNSAAHFGQELVKALVTR